ncbi:MAG: hypothetical protein R3C59_26020 [Planctomycetaceae bacterium]
MSKITLLLNDVTDTSNAADRDVLTQCREISDALTRLGHEVSTVPCNLNLADVRSRLVRIDPDVVFNLVETLGETDRLMPMATLLLDAMNLPYTGSNTRAILLSGDKRQAKQMLVAAGIPTPAWYDEDSGTFSAMAGQEVTQCIVKANYEHASFGMDDDAIVEFHDAAQLRQLLTDRRRSTGRVHLAEQFISGREFNLSVLDVDGQPQVLAPAEIDFCGLPEHLPRIVGARAKWDEDSVEYQQTPHTFNFPAADQPLLDELSKLATRCWHLFGLSGYGRVDFRVDECGQPFVLEVNANPCLSQDAGFIAAAAQSRISYDDLIEQIALSPAQERPRFGNSCGHHLPERRDLS